MSVVYKSNSKQFNSFLQAGIKASLVDMGRVGVRNIANETPIDTGELVTGNEYAVEDDELYFYNDVDYAPYVELGTINQGSNPFMRRGINSSIPEFTNIIVKNLKV